MPQESGLSLHHAPSMPLRNERMMLGKEAWIGFERATHVMPLRTLVLAANVLNLSPPENISTKMEARLGVQLALAAATPSSPSSAVDSSDLAIVV
jgi:hypothetical protein